VAKGPALCSLLLAAALGLSGCGKKGPLVPPEALAPAPVYDLALAQKGGRFLVSWSAPSREEGGAQLHDLAGFLLFRRVVLPPAEDCEECPTAYRELAHVDLDYLKGVRRIGNRFSYDDSDLTKGKTYQYKLRSFMSDGTQSKDSNKARRTVLAPPPPPVLEALPTPNSLVLAFVAPQPEQGALTGYNVYRSKSGEAMPSAPLNAAPITAKTYEDKNVLVGVRYSYTATSLTTVSGETAESLPSNRVEAALTERD
jgi:predicted small lipoprotein YifL